MHYFYIIFSRSKNRYYIGESENVELRLTQHNSGFFKGAYTKQANDWELILKLKCESKTIAKKIELHVKKMKSRRYIENLVKYEEIQVKLIERFT